MTDQKIYIKAATQISMQQPLSEAWLTAPERPDVPYQRSQDPNFRDWLNPLESRRMGKLMKRALVTAQKVMKETAGLAFPDASTAVYAGYCREKDGSDPLQCSWESIYVIRAYRSTVPCSMPSCRCGWEI